MKNGMLWETVADPRFRNMCDSLLASVGEWGNWADRNGICFSCPSVSCA